jgi:hypothetical protein
MMSKRIINHVLFWFGFISLYVMVGMFFISPSDEVYSFFVQVLRKYFQELAFLPWKALPFYFLFYYLIPKYFPRGEYLKLSLLFLGVIIICLLGYRSTIEPVRMFLYGDEPEFNVFSISRILYSLTDLLPALGLASSAKLLMGSIVSRRKEKELEAEKQEAELKFLKAQTNPHFLFNTLNNLYGLARRKDENTADSILKLSNIMRYLLNDCSKPMNSIQNEIGIIEDYIQLEELRYDERLKLSFEKELDDYAYQIAPLILLPFVENAFKHGASENRNDIYIDIYVKLKEGQLEFRIKNNRDNEDIHVQEGIGLKNVKRQLEIIYGDNCDLEIYSDKESFTVKLLIYPLSNDTK